MSPIERSIALVAAPGMGASHFSQLTGELDVLDGIARSAGGLATEPPAGPDCGVVTPHRRVDPAQAATGTSISTGAQSGATHRRRCVIPTHVRQHLRPSSVARPGDSRRDRDHRRGPERGIGRDRADTRTAPRRRLLRSPPSRGVRSHRVVGGDPGRPSHYATTMQARRLRFARPCCGRSSSYETPWTSLWRQLRRGRTPRSPICEISLLRSRISWASSQDRESCRATQLARPRCWNARASPLLARSHWRP